MGTAGRIRSYRIRSGKTRGELADQLGLNPAWYDDLEREDDMLASTLTLFQAIALASLLGVRLRNLCSAKATADDHVALTDLPQRIRAHVESEGIAMSQFAEQLGWELDEFLRSPLAAAAELPLAFLQDVANRLGIDWLSLVPDEDM